MGRGIISVKSILLDNNLCSACVEILGPFFRKKYFHGAFKIINNKTKRLTADIDFTWDVGKSELIKLIELWELVWDGFKNNRFCLLPCMKYYRTRCVQKFLVRFKRGVVGKQLPVYCDISKVSSVSKNTGDTEGNIISQRVEHKYFFKC